MGLQVRSTWRDAMRAPPRDCGRVSRGIDHIAGETFHARRGAVRNAFRYAVDYVCLDAEAEPGGAAPVFAQPRQLDLAA